MPGKGSCSPARFPYRSSSESVLVKQMILFASAKPMLLWKARLSELVSSQSLANSVQPISPAQSSQALRSARANP